MWTLYVCVLCERRKMKVKEKQWKEQTEMKNDQTNKYKEQAKKKKRLFERTK